jgi:hypothetical protein
LIDESDHNVRYFHSEIHSDKMTNKLLFFLTNKIMD